MRYFLGIDPGLNGALAFYDPMEDRLSIYDTPTHRVKVGKSKKQVLDLHRMANILDEWSVNTKIAALEEVGAMPGQGVTSMFNFGHTAGATQMAVVANAIPLVMLRPSVWKKAMGVKADKDSSRQQASRLLPKHTKQWDLKKHDGRAEAALLAVYLSRIEPGLPIEAKTETHNLEELI